MEINEILLRLLRGHWKLLLVAFVVPVLAVGVVVGATPRTYAAWARIQAGTSLPGSDTEADALLNRVKGVATSDAILRSALASARITGRDLRTLANQVDVNRLGSSDVFDVSVADREQAVATTLTQALTTAVVDFLNSRGENRSLALVQQLETQVNELRDQRQKAATGLTLTHDPSRSADISATISGLDQQLDNLTSTIRQAQLTAAESGTSTIISPAVATGATPSSLATDLGLGGLVGLMAGLLLASALEVLRPRAADGRAFARESGVPLLGTLPRPDAEKPDGLVTAPELAVAVRTAITRHDVEQVRLVGPAEPDRLMFLAARLRRALRALPGSRLNGVVTPARSARIPVPVGARACTGTNGIGYPAVAAAEPLAAPAMATIRGDSPYAGGRWGLLLVVPPLARYDALRHLTELSAATGWPMIGVLADPGGPTRTWLRLPWRSR